jgi:type IX secretion system PorP/SprF family membrane protein
MSRLILTILTVLFPLQLIGQMFPLSDQYLNNTLAINPAFAGCHDALSITLMYRDQMAGFDGAPKNSNISVHAPLRNNRIGLGLNFSSSSYGINSENSLTGNYSYRIEAGKGMLALGLGFSATVLKVAWNELKASDSDDQLLTEYPVSATLPDFSLGAYYYSGKYFIGLSIPMFLGHEFNYSTGKYNIRNDFSQYTYFLEGGYYFNISDNIQFLPSVLIKYQQGHTPQADIDAQLIFRDRIRFGMGYRNSNTLLGMFQCNISKQLMVAYTYGYGMSSVNQYLKGSHEIIFNYVFSFSRKVMSPRQF